MKTVKHPRYDIIEFECSFYDANDKQLSVADYFNIEYAYLDIDKDDRYLKPYVSERECFRVGFCEDLENIETVFEEING